MDALIAFLNDIYPYIAVAVFLIGSWLRYDYGAYTWRASSSQLLSKSGMWVGSNLFHIGILGLVIAHIVGVIAFGSVFGTLDYNIGFGILIVLGGGFLFLRRLTNTRVRGTSKRSDLLIIGLLVLMAIFGLVMTVGASHGFDYVYETDVIHKALGWTLLLIFPFTRLVHVWSIPLGYLFRSHQIVRVRVRR
ncbi:MAG: respiratory nitrate reductase subunit gamma [Burkholderiales bacterium]|jgi:nitrate reductase gamma subunit|nr:respiratory nitrate reductase subunit gamma [Burkholderiales bacterium]